MLLMSCTYLWVVIVCSFPLSALLLSLLSTPLFFPLHLPPYWKLTLWWRRVFLKGDGTLLDLWARVETMMACLWLKAWFTRLFFLMNMRGWGQIDGQSISSHSSVNLFNSSSNDVAHSIPSTNPENVLPWSFASCSFSNKLCLRAPCTEL